MLQLMISMSHCETCKTSDLTDIPQNLNKSTSRKLKAKLDNFPKKQINSGNHEDCNDLNDDFGAYSNTLCVVDSRNVTIDVFLTKAASHPLVTIEPIKTCLNLENIASL